jgi:hypothetical protein
MDAASGVLSGPVLFAASFTKSPGSLCREKPFDGKGSLVGVLLREKVAALHRLSAHVRSPLPPNYTLGLSGDKSTPSIA